jgi:hypothetical protein
VVVILMDLFRKWTTTEKPKFEKHLFQNLKNHVLVFVVQIQANVKVLTAERDKLNTMYEEVIIFTTKLDCKCKP